MQARRMLLWLVSALVAIVVVTALSGPVRDATRRSSPPDRGPQAPAATPAPTRVQLEPDDGDPFVLLAERDGQEVSLPAGREGRIEIHAGTAVALQVGDDGPIELAEPGSPAEFTVFGDAGLDEPIRRLSADGGRDIGYDIGRIRTAGPARSQAGTG